MFDWLETPSCWQICPRSNKVLSVPEWKPQPTHLNDRDKCCICSKRHNAKACPEINKSVEEKESKCPNCGVKHSASYRSCPKFKIAKEVTTSQFICNITLVLPDLHWLPVRHRINFKIATITFKVLQFQQPSYLAALIPRYVSTRSLRSSSSLALCVPNRKTGMAKSKIIFICCLKCLE